MESMGHRRYELTVRWKRIFWENGWKRNQAIAWKEEVKDWKGMVI